MNYFYKIMRVLLKLAFEVDTFIFNILDYYGKLINPFKLWKENFPQTELFFIKRN